MENNTTDKVSEDIIIESDSDSLTVKQKNNIDSLNNNWRLGNTIYVESTQEWSKNDWQYFINQVSNDTIIPTLRRFDEAFLLSKYHDDDLQSQWLSRLIANGYFPSKIKERTIGLLSRNTKLSYLLPVYSALNKFNGNLADSLLNEFQSNYTEETKIALENKLKEE